MPQLRFFIIFLKKKLDREVGSSGSDQAEFFLAFWICFNLTRPLSSFWFIWIHLSYGSTIIINIFTVTVRGSSLDVYRRQWLVGGGPRVVVSTAAFHARVRGSVPGLSGLKKTKNVSSPSMCERQYCGEPPWPRGSVLYLKPPGLEFRIRCLEDSVISIISPSSGGSPGPV